MKKKLFLGILAAAAVSFTACQKDEVLNEVQQDEAISFSTYLGRGAQTKGTVIDTDKLGELGFGVFAYYTGQDDADEDNIKGDPNFMNNVKVTYGDWKQDPDDDPKNNSWGYSDLKYWPNTTGDKISFFAYAPHTENQTKLKVYTKSGGPTGDDTPVYLTYVLDYNDYKNHIDVLFAPKQLNTTKQSTVNLTFYHALSRVGFKVKNNMDYGNTKIKLKSVSLSGKLIWSGTMFLNKATVTSTTSNSVTTTKVNNNWENTDGYKGDIKFTVSDGEDVNSTSPRIVGTGNEYLMLFPQTFTGNGSDKITLTAVYTVDEIENTVSKDIEEEFTFEAGKAYTFVINIGLATVDFTANVVPWDTDIDGDGNTTDDDGDNTNIEINN